MITRIAMIVGVLIAGGCTKKSDSSGVSGGPGAPNFRLICESTDTAQDSAFFCIRMDTRTGDVRRVAVGALPISQGLTKADKRRPGRYELVCHSTRNQALSNLYCVRFDTETGDAMLVGLKKAGLVPEGAAEEDSRIVLSGGEHSHGPDTHTHDTREPSQPAPTPPAGR